MPTLPWLEWSWDGAWEASMTRRSSGGLRCAWLISAGFDRYAARVYALFSGLVGPYGITLRECYDIAARATEMEPERGGVVYSGCAWTCGVGLLLDSGGVLAEVQRYAEQGLAYLRTRKSALAIEFMVIPLVLVRALRGITPEFSSFDDADFKEAQYDSYLVGNPHFAHAVTRYRIRRLQLQYYCGNYAACFALISQLDGHLSGQGTVAPAAWRRDACRRRGSNKSRRSVR